MRPVQNANESPAQSSVVSSTPQSLTTQTTAQGSKPQDVKPQDAKTQDRQALASAVEQLNQHFKSLPRTQLQFTIDEKADRIVVKVMDAEKNEVIRQIPPEDVLKLAASLKDKINMQAEKLQQVVLATANKPSAEASLDSLLLRDQA
ncbi:MAG: flagellar protein FlaG [Candidatus Competibacteraceae bacterium]|nr:flagellar protein FlaG [Candidatus Competibacteraceae bacterium]HRY15578.1 flagellar protein FlaG [Candidatus Competibacteraceae bacterium]